MKKLFSGLLATTLAATFAIATIAPLGAAPLSAPRTEIAQTDVQMVKDWRHDGRKADRHQSRRHDEVRRDADASYYNGHRGYREHRHGYRQHNGMWFPAAAFITGAIVAGAINNNADSGRNAHVQWCYDHYRSYRASSNTYKPDGAPRRQCNSPYN
jgi:hypothetical protein